MGKLPYYKSLSKSDQKIYDQSDVITTIKLSEAKRFAPYVRGLERALSDESRRGVEQSSKRLVWALAKVFAVPTPRLRVLARRPADDYGELHGLYEFSKGPHDAIITLWMRTVKRKQVVAFKTYLRTVVHEFCHHLDYTALKLEDSFHTQGFYQRESSLLKQLLAEQN